MRLLLDTNVLLDAVLGRAPFADDALALFAAAETGRLTGLVGATSLTTVHYIARKAFGDARAIESVARLVRVFEVASVTRAVFEDAVAAPLGDFEDAVLAHAGAHAGATGVVTRDPTGFAGGPLRVYTPADLLAALSSA